MISRVAIDELRGPILRDVSRSFYLSLRLLPRPLRDPISLAYLLARATDTVADTTAIDASIRLDALQKLADILQHGGPVADLCARFVPLQTNEAERKLIVALPAAIEWLEASESDDAADIRRVLVHINEGQRIDIERFANSTKVSSFETPEELTHYTYLVAGSVGEFWTSISARKLSRFSDRPEAEMHSLGRTYGQALQLINILRDAGADFRAGRCYLPAEQLRAAGTEPGDLINNRVAFETVFRQWLAIATAQLAAGFAYARALRPVRLRIATALPAVIGERTLALLDSAGGEVLDRKVKMPRGEVRQIVGSLVLRRGYLK